MQHAQIQILDRYVHLQEADEDIIFLYGGRDSGKSHDMAIRVILKMLQPEYFRGILVKKTYESIRDAQWQLIKDIVYEHGMGHLFKFTESPLTISTTINDNRCIARGCDKPEKLKSISNPNFVWYEEGNQLTRDDYETISTTLRTNEGRVQEWFSFNPECKGDYKEFWLYKDWFADQKELSFVAEKVMTTHKGDVKIRYRAEHSTYQDNPFCSAERIARHERLRIVNPYRYKVFTKGLWGNEDNDSPWAWALNRDKHYTHQAYQVSKNYPLDLSFDFNHDPCVCVIGQVQHHVPHYAIIGYIKASSGTESAIKQLCDRIRTMFPHHAATRQLIITGDASGTARDASRPATTSRYTEICRYLGINEAAVKIERANTTHKASRDLCNAVLHQIPEGGYLFYGGQGCEMLLSEIEAAFPDNDESLNKYKKEAGGHGVDAWRYLNQLWYAHRLTGARFREYQGVIDGIARRLSAKKG